MMNIFVILYSVVSRSWSLKEQQPIALFLML